MIHSALSLNHLAIQNKPHITVKHGFCNSSGYKVSMAHLNGSFNGCCLVQFLLSFENNRIAKFSLPKKAALVTQSFMHLHDNTKQIMVKFHTLKGKYGFNIWYIWIFNTVKLCLEIEFNCLQKLNGIKHSSLHNFGVWLPNPN